MVGKSEKIISSGINYQFKINNSYNVEEKVEDEGKEKEWLIIHYGAGDNRLASFILSNVDKLERVGSDENIHMVSILDVGYQKIRGFGEGEPIIGGQKLFEGAKVFYIKQDKDIGEINSPIIKDLGQVNMANPVFMANIIKEVIKKYPAKKIAIFVDGRGYGWQGVVEDNTAKKVMEIREVREALEEVSNSIGKKIDVLAFQASSMAMAEVGYELKDVVKYMIASQTDGERYVPSRWRYERGEYNYELALKDLQSVSGKVEPEEFAKIIVGSAKEGTMSAVNLEKARDLVEAINSFAISVLKRIKWNDSMDAMLIKEKISSVQTTTFIYDDYDDLKHFVKVIMDLMKEDERMVNNSNISKVLSKVTNELMNTLNNEERKRVLHSNYRDLKHF
ncbi:MAG: clostripain-related cysteine peptidase, partial [bacterium]